MKKYDKRYSTVKKVMESKGISQRDLAKKLGCKQNAVWVFLKTLKNKGNPREITVIKYAEALEIPFESLIKHSEVKNGRG